ncbi:MAG: helix-turn-helix transcriptional regulator [Aquabacterium sp.]|nr:helix-turn-helix transcriptional regulator [Aquabacterium sp.]
MSSAASARLTLRQLCRLELPGPVLLPSLLPVLRQVVPATHAGFFFCDERGTITNMYAERMLEPERMAGYHAQHDSAQFRQQYLARCAAGHALSRRSVTPDERGSAYYRDVLSALGIEHFLYAIVRHGGRALGQLSLYRGPDDRPFDDGDEQALASVLHYLGIAVAEPSPPALRELQEQVVEEGLALLDERSGKVMYADGNWPRLVRLAHGDAINPSLARSEHETLPRFIAAVLATVVSAPNAVHMVRTTWGQFVFRRHALTAGDGSTAVALLLSRLAAQPLRQAQGAAVLGLSPQQREVALLLARGLSNQEIAGELGISVNTAGYHAKRVFERLGVHERSAIGGVLGAAAGQLAS